MDYLLWKAPFVRGIQFGQLVCRPDKSPVGSVKPKRAVEACAYKTKYDVAAMW